MRNLLISVFFFLISLPAFAEEPLTIDLDGKGVNGSFYINAVPSQSLPENQSVQYLLYKNNALIATASSPNKQVRTYLARWKNTSGNLIKDWSEVLTETELTPFYLKVEFADGSSVVSNTFNIKYQSELVADYTFDTVFPQTGPDVPVTMTANVTGASGNQTYQWYQAIDWFMVLNTGDQDVNHLDSDADHSQIDLMLAGGTYAAYSWGGVQLTLKVVDGNNVSFKKQLALIDEPYQSGSPSSASVPSAQNVALSNGNLFLSTVDMQVPSKGLDFVLSRSFNSNRGSEWRFNYQQWLTQRQSGIIEYNDAGTVKRFFQDEQGLWHNFGRSFDILRYDDSSKRFTIYKKSGLIYEFDSLVATGNDTDLVARLSALKDRDGNATTLSYAQADTLEPSKITDSQGRDYTFSYAYEENGAKKTVTVTDFTGRSVEYVWLKPNTVYYLSEFKNVMGDVTRFQYGSEFTITDPNNDVYKYVFDEDDRVKSYTDPRGYVTQYTYIDSDASNLVVSTASVILPGETKATTYYFDKRGRVTSVVDAKSQVSKQQSVVPDSVNKVAELILPSVIQNPLAVENDYASLRAYSDDGRGNLIQEEDALGGIAAKVWNTQIRPTDKRLTNLNLLKSYQPKGLASNQVYSYSYNALGHKTQTRDPLGNTSNYEYNTDGQRTKVTDAKGFATLYAYASGTGNLIATEYENGNKVTMEYDALGRMIKKTTLSGDYSYTYDAAGRTLTETNPLNHTTTYTYDKNGNRITVTNPKGYTTTYAYFPGNLIKSVSVEVAGETLTTSYQYDQKGRVISTTDRRGNSSSTAYNELGQTVSETNALSQTTSYTYDENGNLKTLKDPLGRITNHTYDILNRLTSVTDYMGNKTQYEYNAQGLKSKEIDPNGVVKTYGYDALGQMISVVIDGEETKSTYDENGNLKTVTDPKGQVTTYTYDNMNRQVQLKDDSGAIWKTEYDIQGRVTKKVFPDGQTIEKTYDAIGQVKTQKEYDSSNSLTRSLSYTYDKLGNIESVTNAITSITQSYTYDEIDRVSSVTDAFGNTIGYQYDANGNVTTMTYPGNKTVTYAYDSANRLQSVTDWLGNVTTYARNTNGQITQQVLGNSTVVKYGYDNANRLISLSNTTSDGTVLSSYQLTRDANGNITESNNTIPLEYRPTSEKVQTFGYGDGNRLSSMSTEFTATGQNITSSFNHDINGRVLQQSIDGQDINFTFNIEDLITQVTKDGSTLASYVYDNHSNRISRTADGLTTRYVVDNNAQLAKVIMETDGSNNPKYYYIYGDGLISQIDAQNNVRYYHYDQTGNTQLLTDSNQAIVQQYGYSPYGETIADNSTHNPFQYSGKWGVLSEQLDNNAIPLIYMRARYYSPEIKRFVSLDALMGSMMDPMTLNRYAYVSGNPISNIDPSGNECKSVDGKYLYDDPSDIVQGLGCSYKYTLTDYFEVDGNASLRMVTDINKVNPAENYALVKTLLTNDAQVDGELSIIPRVNNSDFLGDSQLGIGGKAAFYAGFGAHILSEENTVGYEGGIGVCGSVEQVTDVEVLGIRLQSDVGLSGGACINGRVAAYDDKGYVGTEVSGSLAALWGGAGRVSVSVNKTKGVGLLAWKTGANIHQQVEKVNTYKDKVSNSLSNMYWMSNGPLGY